MPRRNEPNLIAKLNDLLQLEHDALPMYTLAIMGTRDPERRAHLVAFREDHRRHARELAGLIRERGGLPLHLPHLPTGLLKLGVQAAGLPGGDRTVLLAFRANEWQSQAKYARFAAAAGDLEPDVAQVLRRAAEDEARHYAWAAATLDELGLGTGTPAGFANAAFARFHGMAAEAVEAAGRLGLEALARVPGPPGAAGRGR
jgi:hypothetical protein